MVDPPQDESRALVEAAKGGSAPAVSTLIERHLPGLRAFVHLRAGRLLRDREGVSDLVQAACVEVLQDLDRHAYKGESHFKCWLYQAAARKVVDRARYWGAEKRNPAREADPVAGPSRAGEELFQSFATPSRAAVRREEFESLEAAFERLPEPYREVILQHRLLGRPHAEIAREMGRSEAAVRTLLSRALARLTTLLGDGAS